MQASRKILNHFEKGSYKELQRIVERFGNRQHLSGIAIYNRQGEPILCARNGSRYVIAGNDGNYELAGDPEQFSALAGRRVNLVGVLHGNTITVSSASLQGRPSSYSGGGDSQ